MLTNLIHYILEKEIKELNNAYRGINDATDVLSFPLIEDFTIEFSDYVYPIGDVVISIDKVNEQSLNYNHSFERELAFLTVHSLLHLLGYTHETNETEKEMFSRQNFILKEFGLERK